MSYKTCTFYLIGCLLFFNTANATEVFPVPFEADYSLHSMGNKIAKMKRRFTHLNNGEYLYHSETNTTGLLSLFRKDHILERSTWHIDDNRIRPLLYNYEHTGGKKDRSVTIQFDWESNQIINSINGSSWQMPLQPDIMDKLLYQLAIMHDLVQGKKAIKYVIADGGKIKLYNFNLLGEELIETPLGELETLKLERHKPNSRRKTTLWCARELGYLPVKVVNIEKDGRKTTAIIESVTGMNF